MLRIIVLQVLCLFSFLPVYSQIGCRTGDYIYTVQNGIYINGASTIPKFTATNRIIKRNYDQDPNCGINRNIADGYPKVSGTLANPNSECTSDNNLGDIGQLIMYNSSDNSCQLPIDDYMWTLLLAWGVFGYFLIRHKINSST